MYAVIMAGGEGTRLRPLTVTIPKPLVPVAGKAAIIRIAQLLARHNITNAAVTTMYLADKLEQYCGSSQYGVNLRYFRENEPLGTAGSVKNTLSMLSSDAGEDSFLVISGDAVCDFNLSAAIAFHKEKNAGVTIVLTKVDVPLEYGVVQCGPDGKIQRFIEKPGLTQAFCNTVNTGIYIIKRSIIENIPDGFYDFGRDLFPALQKQQDILYGYEAQGYWCDIGDLEAFYGCNLYMAKAEGTLDKNGNVTGQNCKIADGAKITNSVLLDNVTVGADCVIEESILCENVTVGNNSVIKSGCVVGADSKIGNSVIIRRGMKIWNNKTIEDGTAVMRDVVFGQIKADIFCDGGISGDSDTLSASCCVKIGEAVASASKKGKIGVMYGTDRMHTHENLPRHIANSLLCGVVSGGAAGFALEGGFEGLAAFAASRLKFDIVMFAALSGNDTNTVKITFYDKNGLYPDRSFERALAASLAKDSPRPAQNPKEIQNFSAVRYLYKTMLLDMTENLTGFSAAVSANSAGGILGEVLREKGATVYTETNADHGARLFLYPDNGGTDLIVREYDSSNRITECDRWHVMAIIEQNEISSGMRNLTLPYSAPAMLEKIALDNGITVQRYSYCPYNGEESKIRQSAWENGWVLDSVMMAVKLCSIFARKKISLNALLKNIPSFYGKSAEYEYSAKGNYGNALKVISRIGIPTAEGVIIGYDTGNVRIVPSRGGIYKMYSEASSAEAAEELISLSKKKIEELSKSV